MSAPMTVKYNAGKHFFDQKCKLNFAITCAIADKNVDDEVYQT